MQAKNTNNVIDVRKLHVHLSNMLTHDELLEEFKKQFSQGRIKQSDVAKVLNVAAPRISEIIRGFRRIQSSEMAPLAEFLNISSPIAEVKTSQIPYYGKVAAGVWLEQDFVDDHNREFIPFDKMPNDDSGDELFAVSLEGDSMNLRFKQKGVKLICKRIPFGFEEVEAGKYFIIEREVQDLREMTCKRVEIDKNGDFLLVAESSNPKHSEPIRVPKSNDDEFVSSPIRAIGRVIRAVEDFH